MTFIQGGSHHCSPSIYLLSWNQAIKYVLKCERKCIRSTTKCIIKLHWLIASGWNWRMRGTVLACLLDVLRAGWCNTGFIETSSARIIVGKKMFSIKNMVKTDLSSDMVYLKESKLSCSQIASCPSLYGSQGILAACDNDPRPPTFILKGEM